MEIHENPSNTRYSNALEIELQTRFSAISIDYVTNIGLQIEATNTISVKIKFDLDFGAISNSISNYYYYHYYYYYYYYYYIL